VGLDLPIQELAAYVARTVGYQGGIDYDISKPDGTKQKLLDTSLIESFGWSPEIPLYYGLQSTYEDFLKYHTA
jgi:GDP-L-fucose synthase